MIDRYHGALLGLAVGDALGTTLEFRAKGSFEPIDDMVGGGPFGLEPGEWTDDTSMALCLAESLPGRGFDPHDQMTRYLRWWRDGYWSSTGRCFDIGITVASALRRFEETGDPMAGSTDPHSAGNGSLMRLAPVPLRYAHDPAEAVRLAGESSRTTHGAAEAVDACRYFATLIVAALAGRSKEELLRGSTVVPGGRTVDARDRGDRRRQLPDQERGPHSSLGVCRPHAGGGVVGVLQQRHLPRRGPAGRQPGGGR